MPINLPDDMAFIGVGSEDAKDTTTRQRVADVADELAEAGKRGSRKVGKATEADWEEFLGILLGYFSLLFAWFLISGTGASRTEREEIELTDEEAGAMARPLARILARSALNARYGKHVLGGSDYLVLAIVMTTYVERITPHVKRKVSTLWTPNPKTPKTPKESPNNAQLAESYNPIFGNNLT